MGRSRWSCPDVGQHPHWLERDSATDLIIEVLILRHDDVDHVSGLPASVGRHHRVKLRHNKCDRSSPRDNRCAAPLSVAKICCLVLSV